MNYHAAFLAALCQGLCLAAPSAKADVVARFTTTVGVIEAQLDPEHAPGTVANFVELARKGFYDGTPFHRVMPGLAVFGGDPTGTGTGGPGYCIKDEFNPGLRHAQAGVLSMVTSAPDSGGSQFLITLAPAPVFDNRDTAFGQVTTTSLDVLSKIAAAPVGDVRLTRVEVVGAYTPAAFTKVKEYSDDELTELARRPSLGLLGGVGKALGLGKVEQLKLDAVHGRCGDGQVSWTADFQKEKGVRLAVFGNADGAGFRVRQFQVGRR